MTTGNLNTSYIERDQQVTRKNYQSGFELTDAYSNNEISNNIFTFWNPFLGNATVDYIFFTSQNLNLLRAREVIFYFFF